MEVPVLYLNFRHLIIRNKYWIVELICALFVCLFMYAALSKWFDYSKFLIQLSQSPLLTHFAKPVAWMVLSLELVIVLFLFIERLRLMGLYMAFTMMAVFTAYIVTITRFSEYVPCSCGGVLQKMTWSQHLIFNLFFMVLAFLGICIQSSLQTIHSSIKKEDKKQSTHLLQ